MLLSVPNTFANGTGPANIIDATQMNANFAAVATVLNGEIEKNNIKTGSAICLNDTAMAVSAIWTFSANPVFNAGGIADASLTSNIPKKDAVNTFAAKQTFSAGTDHTKQEAENFTLEKAAGLPAWTSADKGRLMFDSVTNQGYIGGPTDWVRIDYIGGYTGGAISRYAATAIVDDSDGFKLYFKTEGGSPTVKLAFKGEPYPKRFYLELPYHTHAFTGITHNHAITDGQHNHSVDLGLHGHGGDFALGTHSHDVTGSTGGTSGNHVHGMNDHLHTYNSPLGGSWYDTTAADPSDTEGQDADHDHSISLSTGGPSGSSSVDDENLGTPDTSSDPTGITVNNKVAGGTNANAGVDIGGSLSTTQKLYGKSLTIKIDGTNITSDILTDTGWAAIGDGLLTHAFHTTGTGELDASGYKSYAAGYHILEILEPESGYGCQVMIHIETS